MRRHIAFIASALLLSGILAALLSARGRHSHPAPQPTPASPAPLSFIGRVFQSLRSENAKASQAGSPVSRSASQPIPELRVAALRGLNNYGWVQLPRGTPVELVAADGEYLVVRYDETVVRIHRCIADAGLVVPRPARMARL